MKFDAILFDCDGVLVDSEPLTNGVLCAMLNEAGWAISPTQCMELFVGKMVRSEAARIERHTGQPLTDAWMESFYARRNAAITQHLQPIAGAVEAVRAVHALMDGRIACASGADRFKVEMQLRQVGLDALFAGRVLSGHEMPATKPAPDVYLAAAAALGVSPARCLVIEDTVTGITAGVAAGATVWAYSPVAFRSAGDAADNAAAFDPQSTRDAASHTATAHRRDDALRNAGAARLFRHMSQLPGMLKHSDGESLVR